MPSSGQIACYNGSFVTMVAGGTRVGRSRKQIKEPVVIIVDQKRGWFFAIKDRFIEF